MSTSQFKYPYPWAENVVQLFYEKYARATDNTAILAGLSSKDLRFRMISMLRSGKDRRWEVMKRVIKRMDREEMADLKLLTDEMRKKYLTYVKYEVEDELLDGLISAERS